MTHDSANVGGGCGTEKENTKTENCQINEGSNPTPGANNILLDEHSPSGVLLALSEEFGVFDVANVFKAQLD